MHFGPKNTFEEELKRNLSLRTSGHSTEELVLLKAFRYFDLQSTGLCDREKFVKSIAKVGSSRFGEEELGKIFSDFYADEEGLLNYREFIGNLYNNDAYKISAKRQAELRKSEEDFRKFQEEKQRAKEKLKAEIENEIQKESFEGERQANYEGNKGESVENEGERLTDLNKLPPQSQERPPHEPDTQLNEAPEEDEKIDDSKIEQLIFRLRAVLSERGLSFLIRLENDFRLNDQENSQDFDYDTFKLAMEEGKFGLSGREIDDLFEAFKNNNRVDYDEFLRVVRGELSEPRLNLVEKVFSALDMRKTGHLTLEELFELYVAEGNPNVLLGRLTPNEGRQEFEDTFLVNHKYLNGDEYESKDVDLDEFKDYYESLSLMINDDRLFEDSLLISWGIKPSPQEEAKLKKKEEEKLREKEAEEENIVNNNNIIKEENVDLNNVGGKCRAIKRFKRHPITVPKNPQNSQLSQETPKKTEDEKAPKTSDQSPKIPKLKQREEQLHKRWLKGENLGGKDGQKLPSAYQQVKDQLVKKGIKGGVDLWNRFKQFDRVGDKSLGYGDFKEALESNQIYLNKEDIKQIFNELEDKKTNSINYMEFLNRILGDLSPRKLRVVEEAFERINLDRKNYITLENVKETFSSKNNPVVNRGLVSEEQFYLDFFNSFENHHYLYRSAILKNIRLEEFINYFKFLALVYNDDVLFELMMRSMWRMRSPVY